MANLRLLGYLAIPLAFAVHLWIGKGASWEPIATFVLAGLGVLPLASLMGESTEHLAEKTGPTWGGLLNATFGNAAELIIAIIALSKGMNEVVKASLTGSILGNLLLVGGAAMVAGGWNRERQKFSRHAAEANGGLLAVAVAAMLTPAIFQFSAERLHDARIVQHEHRIAIATSFVLLVVYALGLLFTLRTHRHIFSAPPRSEGDPAAAQGGGHASHEHGEKWSVRKSVTLLLVAAAGIGLIAELLVGSAEKVAHDLGWNSVFVGVILLAIIGNAAEHSTAIMLARRNDMETAMSITHQSSLQIALFVVPVLVLLSWFMVGTGFGMSKEVASPQFLNLVFTPLEVVAIVLAVAIVIILGIDGETNWFEGALLLALYAILAFAFFYLPETAGHGGAGAATGDASPTTLPSTLIPHAL